MDPIFCNGSLWPNSSGVVGSLAAWYDSLDTSSMLSSAGTVVTAGASVALWSDKSGWSSVNCAVFDGAASNYIATPSSTDFNSTAGVTAEIELSLPTWTPAATCYMFGRWTDGTNRCWLVGINTASKLIFQVSGDGAAIATAALSTTSLSSLFTAFQTVRIRVVYVGDNGAGGRDTTFSYSLDHGASWTVIDATITQATATPVFSGNSMLSIGSLAGGGSPSGSAGMKVYYARLLDSNGVEMAVFDPSTAGKLASSFVSTTGETWTINSTGATGVHISGAHDLYQGTAANRPIYLPWSGSNYGWLNGVAGNYFSTPDSAAIDITGDIDLRVRVTAADYSPSASQTLIAKDSGAPNRHFILRIDAAGTLGFLVSADGTNLLTATSTAVSGVTDGTETWLRATLDVDNGAAGWTVYFYKSTDGITWVQIGNAVTTATAITISSGAGILEVGSNNSGGNRFIGIIHRAQVYNGIAGTLVADFNPSIYTSGPTFTAATGEVWTVNGGAHIVTRTGLYFDGSNDYLKSAAFPFTQPITVCMVLSKITSTNNDILLDGNTLDSLRFSNGAVATTDYITSNAVNFVSNTGMPNVLTPFLAIGIFNGTFSGLQQNRDSIVTANGGAVAPGGITLMAGTSGGTPGHCFVSELAIFSTAHDFTTRSRLALGFSRKWRFPV